MTFERDECEMGQVSLLRGHRAITIERRPERAPAEREPQSREEALSEGEEAAREAEAECRSRCAGARRRRSVSEKTYQLSIESVPSQWRLAIRNKQGRKDNIRNVLSLGVGSIHRNGNRVITACAQKPDAPAPAERSTGQLLQLTINPFRARTLATGATAYWHWLLQA